MTVVALFLSVIQNDWPRVYLWTLVQCELSGQCIVDLSKIYGFRWETVIWLPDGSSYGFNELDDGRAKIKKEEFCDGLIFLDKKGSVVEEYYSACLDFPSSRDRKLRIGSIGNGVLRIERKYPFLCVINFDTRYAGKNILPQYVLTGCGK
jgi:hypothetical protein